MPKRNFILATSEIYHIYNRSIAKEIIFPTPKYLNKAQEIIDYYRFPHRMRLSKFKTLPLDQRKEYEESFRRSNPLIEIYAFAIMPNHYHLLIKQLQENGIIKFISNFQNSYAKFLNIKIDRSGSVFQKPFKGKRIEDDNQLLHVSRYIHLNPVTAYLIEFEELKFYPWTSFIHYQNSGNDNFIQKEAILNNFKSFKSYSRFVSDQVDYQRNLALIKDLLIE
ncbi:MAG: hypothetical protein A3A51_02045 [Candidatus Levybacteria bacterium RIFCSPLOWO2_01_FULL_39_10]|nr:MAG: hypothetical protein A3A51_02045 [Candidatus Levybacteria bacterium RIFCSPLOWO2_01_FULL_39_10]